MLEVIRRKCDHLYEKTKDEKYKTIKSILENDNCFDEMDADTIMSILMDLNYKEEDCIKLMINITKK